MHRRIWKLAAVFGLLASLILAVAATFIDWKANPAGIFQNDSGTNWPIVVETALSWLWPAALAVVLVVTIFLYVVAWIRNSEKTDAQ